MALWLTELGVKLPPSHALMPTDYANLLRDIKAAWSTVASRLKHKPALPFLTKSLALKWRSALPLLAVVTPATIPPSTIPPAESHAATSPVSESSDSFAADTTGFKLSIPVPYTSLQREIESLRGQLQEIESLRGQLQEAESKFRAECDRHDVTAGESDACRLQNANFKTEIERLHRVCCSAAHACLASHVVSLTCCTHSQLYNSKTLKVTPLRSQNKVLTRTIREEQKAHQVLPPSPPPHWRSLTPPPSHML